MPINAEVILETRNITKTIRQRVILDSIDLRLQSGQVHVLFGENGAGKTTFVRILSGSLPFDKGQIFIKGRQIKIDGPYQALSSGISIVHQQFSLFRGLSVAANLFMGRQPRKGLFVNKRRMLEEASLHLSRLQFVSAIDPRETVNNLSAGQQQQIQIARGILQESPIVVLDDPTSLLSDEEMTGLNTTIDRLKAEGKAILYCSHRIDETRRLADQVTIIRDGHRVNLLAQKEDITVANLLKSVIGVVFKWSAAPGWPIEYVSAEIEADFGYTPNELTDGKILYNDMIHPDDLDKAYNLLGHSQTLGVDQLEREYRLACPNGEYRWVHESASTIRDSDGTITHYRGVILDISESKKSEEALELSEQKYETLIRNVPGIVYSCLPDETATKVFISDRCRDFTGYSPDDYYKAPNTWPNSIHPEDRTRAIHAYVRSFQKGTDYICEYRLVNKYTKEIRHVRDQATPIKNEKGNINRFDGIITDITRERQLAENLRLYATLITEAQEEERKRIARELHDDTLQAMFSLYTDIEDIKNRRRLSHKANEALTLAQVKVGDIMHDMRCFCHNLRPPLLDRFGLIPSLKLLTEEMNQENSFECFLEANGHERRLAVNTKLALFRVTQEALNNIRKHANASRVNIGIIFTDHKSRLVVSDNGGGFQVPEEIDTLVCQGEMGLVGMQERVRLIGGTLSIESIQGCGTTIIIDVPTN